MSDQNKFINTYIDTTIATLHEYVGSSLQLKTQLKMANDMLAERDVVITQLTGEIENLKNSFSTTQGDANSIRQELISCQDRLRISEESYAAMAGKVSHMDTLLKQLTDMKNEIISRDKQIEDLTNDLNSKIEQISSLTVKKLDKTAEKLVASASKVQINTKNKLKAPNDDF